MHPHAAMRSLLAFAVLALTLGACAHVSDRAVTPAPIAPAAQVTAADLRQRMETIQATIATVEMKLAANTPMQAVTESQLIASAFGDVERFWAQHNRADAVGWSRQARTRAAELAAAATVGDSVKAATALRNLTSTCTQCHAVYREGDAASGFRVKPGVL